MADGVDDKASKFVGLKCPYDLYEKNLLGKRNKSKVLIQGLRDTELVRIFEGLFNRISENAPEAVKAAFDSLSAQEQVKLIDFFSRKR